METFACSKGVGYYGCRKCWNASCPGVPGLGRDPASFDPTQLDTDNWAASIKALGAKYATAKHARPALSTKTSLCSPFSSDGGPAAAHRYPAPWSSRGAAHPKVWLSVAGA